MGHTRVLLRLVPGDSDLEYQVGAPVAGIRYEVGNCQNFPGIAVLIETLRDLPGVDNARVVGREETSEGEEWGYISVTFIGGWLHRKRRAWARAALKQQVKLYNRVRADEPTV